MGVLVRDSSVGSVPTERLEAEVTTLAARLAAATCEWLEMIAELDRRRAWAVWECVSMAHWLSWTCALSLPAAREHVRVGRALEALPQVREEFAAGRLSYSKVRALTRLVTMPEREADLVVLARYATAAQLDRIAAGYVRAQRLADPDQAARNEACRALSWRVDDDGMTTLTVRAPNDVIAAIRTAIETERRDEVPAEAAVPVAARRVDALERVAAAYLHADAHTPDTTIVVHAETVAEDAPDQPGPVTVARVAGLSISQAAFERYRCDAAVAVERTLPDGGVDRSRSTDTIPRRVRRAVLQRDGYRCRWPSCTNTGGLHLHHIVWRSRHGTHTLENLLTLCHYHHRGVHDRHWRIEGDPRHRLEFVGPDGRVCTETPDPDVRVAVESLAELHADHIDHRTIATATREPLDLHWAVGVLCDADHLQRRRN